MPKNIETTYLREFLDEADTRKLIEILSGGVCDYLKAASRTASAKAAARRAAEALKTAREIGAKCAEIPTENDLLSGGKDYTL